MRLLVIAFCMSAAVSASAADIRSISRLAAGPENVLFVADWKAARVHAIALPPAAQVPAGTAFNILDLEPLLSREVGGAKVTVEDMVVRPGTAQVYVAVSYGAAKTPALIMVTSDRVARRVDLKAAKATSTALRDAPTSDYKFWKDTPERSFTVTDMKWRDGELFVAGLSNQDFASTLRRVRYPFDSRQSVTGWRGRCAPLPLEEPRGRPVALADRRPPHHRDPLAQLPLGCERRLPERARGGRPARGPPRPAPTGRRHSLLANPSARGRRQRATR